MKCCSCGEHDLEVGNAHRPFYEAKMREGDPLQDRGLVRKEELGQGEFLVSVTKDTVGTGLEVESIRGMLLVSRVKKGPVSAWNERHADNPEVHVKPGDRIVKVNGKQGDDEMLIAEVRGSSSLTMLVRRAHQFNVTVEKNGKELGMAVVGGNVNLDMLKISALREGVIDRWNKSNPDLEVRIEDRIVVVNGVSGDPNDMIETMQQNQRLEMTLIRPF